METYLAVVIFYGRWILVIFDGLDFLDSSLVSAAREIGAEPDLDHFAKKNLAQKFAGDAKNIGVIMMTRNAGAKLIVTKSGANTFDFVGADAHSDTGTASQNGSVGFFLSDGPG
jgi:pyridoxal biosynthesis lyase PdxS